MGFTQLKTGFYFSDSVENSNFQRSEEDLQTRYDIKYSTRLVKKTKNGYEEFGFGRPVARKEIDLLLVNQLPLIHKFTDYFHTEMRSVIQDMQHNPVNLASDLPLFSFNKTGIPNIELVQTTYSQLVQKLGCQTDFLNVKFTEREIDILRLYYKGCSAKNVAQRLFLSTRTVENYLANIKEKLLCENKSELINRLHLMKDLSSHPEIFI